MIGDGLSVSCIGMPRIVVPCPTCGEGMRQFRGTRWIDAKHFFGGDCVAHGLVDMRPTYCQSCVFEQTKVLLTWVGDKFYTPETFVSEAHKLGVSKRIPAVPNDFVPGSTWVLIAHPSAGKVEAWKEAKAGDQMPLLADWWRKNDDGVVELKYMKDVPAVFYAFQPRKVEMVVTQKMLDTMSEQLTKRNEKYGVEYIIVPEDDKDHNRPKRSNKRKHERAEEL